MEFTESGILRGEGWFVFVKSPNRLWIFDGKKSLAVVEADEGKTLVKECDGEAAAIVPTVAMSVAAHKTGLSHRADRSDRRFKYQPPAAGSGQIICGVVCRSRPFGRFFGAQAAACCGVTPVPRSCSATVSRKYLKKLLSA